MSATAAQTHDTNSPAFYLYSYTIESNGIFKYNFFSCLCKRFVQFPLIMRGGQRYFFCSLCRREIKRGRLWARHDTCAIWLLSAVLYNILNKSYMVKVCACLLAKLNTLAATNNHTSSAQVVIVMCKIA